MTHLVLGYPGAIAARVLEEEARGGSALTVIARGVDSQALPPGVEYIDADPTWIDFGLSGADYGDLVQRVTRITLAASNERSIRDVEESPLVRQASEILEFVRAGGAPKGVSFLSSLLVFGDAQGPVTEADFEVGQQFENREEEALAVAEKLVRRVSTFRPTCIVRTAPVVGDEWSGQLFEHSALSRLARQVESSTEDLPYTFSDLPVRMDTVGRAASALRLARTAVPLTTYHLVDAEPMTDRILFQWLARRAQRNIVETAVANPSWSTRFRPLMGDHKVVRGWALHFDRTNAEAALGSLLDPDPTLILRTFFGDQEEELTLRD